MVVTQKLGVVVLATAGEPELRIKLYLRVSYGAATEKYRWWEGSSNSHPRTD
jgi:hypothetical protein